MYEKKDVLRRISSTRWYPKHFYCLLFLECGFAVLLVSIESLLLFCTDQYKKNINDIEDLLVIEIKLNKAQGMLTNRLPSFCCVFFC